MIVSGWLLSSFICLGSVIGLLGMRQLVLSTDGSMGQSVIWFIMQILPLLVTLPGLISSQVRATFILCLASLLYFIHGVLVAFEPGNLVFGLLIIGFSLGLCGSTAALVRAWREADPARWGKDQ